MKTKLFNLPDDIIEIIHDVMEEKYIKSEVGAVIHMITEYKKRESLSEEIINTFNRTNYEWMNSIKWSSKMADKNTCIILDAVNTILFEMGITLCIPTSDVKSPVVEQSEEELEKRVSRRKQKKDNYRRKKKF